MISCDCEYNNIISFISLQIFPRSVLQTMALVEGLVPGPVQGNSRKRGRENGSQEAALNLDNEALSSVLSSTYICRT